jgi:hypothetical protein
VTRIGFICPVFLPTAAQPGQHPRAIDPIERYHPRKEPLISHNHLITPIIITGGAAVTAILLMSRSNGPKATPPTVPKLTNDNITTEFVAAIPELTPELNLELATATQTEVFTKTDSSRLWGLVDLGTSTVQIRVPVTYRYHVCLREPWRLEIKGRCILVQAPEFHPGLPPAIHTDKLEKLAVRGWARGSVAGLMDQLQKEITPMLIQSASDPRHLELVRERCRQSVAEFVRLWLEREGQWSRHGFTEIQVVFPKEVQPVAPTLRLQ